MGEGHDHGSAKGSHHHSGGARDHAPKDFGRAFAIGIAIQSTCALGHEEAI